jgi:nicotinamidase/pyrazinamidase
MKQVFFVDVDTQHDFMFPSGALYVPGAERLIPKLRKLFDLARRHHIQIVSTADAHIPDDPEFRRFPPHCVKGSEGQKKLGETLLPRPLVLENRNRDMNLIDAVRKYQQIVVEKQSLDVFDNPMTAKLLKALPPRAIVFGVATDYCVKIAALGLCRAGVKTAVVTDAIAALTPESGARALEEMSKAGVEFTTTEALLDLHAA